MHSLSIYVLVKAPSREYTTGIIERGCGREADKARGVAECLIRLRDHIPSSIISVVYERERCFNWFVALANRLYCVFLLVFAA